jgi:hypothetical protein
MLLLPEGQTGEAWEPSKKPCCFGNRAALDRKVLSLLSCLRRAMAQALLSCLRRAMAQALLSCIRRGMAQALLSCLRRAMAQAISRRRVTAEARIPSQVSPCEVHVGRNGTGTGFSPSTYFGFFPVSIIPPMLHPQPHLHVAVTRRTNGRSLRTFQKNALSDFGEHWIAKYFQFSHP